MTLVAVLALAAPVTAHAGATTPLAFAATTFGKGGGEPNVAVSPDGKTVLVSGLSTSASPAKLYRSTDGGRRYKQIVPTFKSSGGGDWDMRWLDNNTVVAADLGNGIYVHRSTDGGLTWKTTTVQTDVYDRPWIEHFGTKIVYLVAKGFDGVPYLYTSTDGGATFGTPPVPVLIYGTGTTPTPVEGLVTNQDAYVDHITVDPKTGEVYVLYGIGGPDSYPSSPPFGVSNRLYVARLDTEAPVPQFVSHAVYLGGADDSLISGFNWMTIDSVGTLYVLANGAHAGHHSARLSYSTDHAKTWTPLVDLGAPGAANVYGSIAAGAPGVLSLVYLRGSVEDPSMPQNWYAEMARVSGANSARPSVQRVRVLAKPVHTKDICFDGLLCGLPNFGNDRNLLDYIWNAVGPDGTAYAVIASDGPATGETSGDPAVVVFRQTSGAKHGRGAPS